jgi:carboxypeptidase C (cathepsin A)
MNTTNQTKPIFNPYSLKNPTNMLYLSQPIGVGFSYGSLGTPNQNITTQFVTTSTANALKVLFSSLVLILPLKIIRTLNIFAQSYGSHFGPVLASSIVSQTRNITSGHPLSKMGTLGIINGLVTVEYHYPSFPAFALHNSHYPIINASAYDEWTAAYSAACQALLADYFTGNPKTPTGQDLCSTATTTCSEWSTEVAHYNPDLDFSEFQYDVRPGHKRPTHEAFKANLNHPDIQYNLTRSPYISYTDCDDTIYSAFYFSRDYVYRDFHAQLGELLDAGVRVALVCGDVNWLYNWMGGEAMALVISHKGKDAFGKTEYEPFLVDDEVVGETKEFGNLSFTRVYDAGRIVPVDQPVAALELLKRAVGVKRVADGKQVKNAVSSPGY